MQPSFRKRINRDTGDLAEIFTLGTLRVFWFVRVGTLLQHCTRGHAK